MKYFLFVLGLFLASNEELAAFGTGDNKNKLFSQLKRIH